MYEIEDPLLSLKKQPPSKQQYSAYVLTKITVYHERKLRKAANKNSKMCYLNVNVIGLNGRFHPALLGVTDSLGVPEMRAHFKFYAMISTHTKGGLIIKVGHPTVGYVLIQMKL